MVDHNRKAPYHQDLGKRSALFLPDFTVSLGLVERRKIELNADENDVITKQLGQLGIVT